jgi:hypothetical protein
MWKLEMNKIFLLESLWGRDRLRHLGLRYEDIIKTDVREVGCEGVEWIQMLRALSNDGLI